MASITGRVKIARETMKRLTELNQMNATLYWHRGKELARLKKDNLWKYVYGDDGGSWANFCFNELKTPASSADQKVVAYNFFVGKHGFPVNDLAPYDTAALYYIAEYKKDEKKSVVKDWMDKTLHVSRKDFLAELRGRECAHKDVHEESEKHLVCDACRKVVMKLDKKKKNGKGVS